MKALKQKTIFAFAAIFAVTLTQSGCVSPMASHSIHTSPLRKGDTFILLSQSAEGHPLRAMDAIVLKELSARSLASGSGTNWLVEYSYAVRPNKIAMKSDAEGDRLTAPHSDAFLKCDQTNHRVTVRIMADDDGKQSYRGFAEKVTCRSQSSADDVIFEQLFSLSLENLRIE